MFMVLTWALLHAQSFAEIGHRAVNIFQIALDALAIPGEHHAAAAARQARIREQPADWFQGHRTTFGTPDRPLIVIAEHGPRLTRTTASAEAPSSEYHSHSLPARKDCAM